MDKRETAKIGIIGGSGFYGFLEGEEIAVNTPYGNPSDRILLSSYQGEEIAFLPRHGWHHQLPPHKINYRANLFALKKLGVKHVLAPAAVGSLKPEIEPGHFVIADQFIDKTKNRIGTFYNGPKVVHVSMARPYCPELRRVVIEACQKLGITCHPEGTVLVIEGPRFSTEAESDYFSHFADVINMTQYPEVVLARELEMCYVNISLVTDYDAGLKGREDVEQVTAQEVKKVFEKNNQKVKELILKVVESLPDDLDCGCSQALKQAHLG